MLPHAFIHFAASFHKSAPSLAFPVFPIADIVVPIRIDEPAVSVVLVVLELTLVNYMVNFLAHALHSAVGSELALDILVVLTEVERQVFFQGLRAISLDIGQIHWTDFFPLFLHFRKSLAVAVIGVLALLVELRIEIRRHLSRCLAHFSVLVRVLVVHFLGYVGLFFL